MASLMCTDRKEWDIDVIKNLFNDRDKRCILNIPVGVDNSEDTLYWRFEQSGNYSVKSAYKFLQEHRGLWRAEDNNSIWKLVWEIKAPSKCLNLV